MISTVRFDVSPLRGKIGILENKQGIFQFFRRGTSPLQCIADPPVLRSVPSAPMTQPASPYYTSPLRAVISASVLFALTASLLVAVPAYAQEAPAGDQQDSSENPYGSGLGFQILLTNSGFGLGGYYFRSISNSTSFMTDISLGAGKDERELKFFRFGSSFIPNKANYLLMMPIQAGFIHRLFRNAIEENFRPYVQVTAGPTLGWEYPYFNDENGDGEYDPREEDSYDSIGALPKGDIRVGIGGTIAIGAHFGLSRKVTQGVRIGYSFTHFMQGIQLLEPQVQEAQQFFGTPTITLTFGKLL